MTAEKETKTIPRKFIQNKSKFEKNIIEEVLKVLEVPNKYSIWYDKELEPILKEAIEKALQYQKEEINSQSKTIYELSTELVDVKKQLQSQKQKFIEKIEKLIEVSLESNGAFTEFISKQEVLKVIGEKE